MSGGVRLTAIDRKNILKAAEQLCKSVHCEFEFGQFRHSKPSRARDFGHGVSVAVATI